MCQPAAQVTGDWPDPCRCYMHCSICRSLSDKLSKNFFNDPSQVQFCIFHCA